MGYNDWLDRCYFKPFECHWLNCFVCIHMQSRIFWCSNYGDFTIEIGDLTYLPFWKDVTNHLHIVKSWTNCIPYFVLHPYLKNIAQISRHYLWPNRLSFTVLRMSTLEHLHPWAEWQALKKACEGLQARNDLFLTRHYPTVTCFLALHIE